MCSSSTTSRGAPPSQSSKGRGRRHGASAGLRVITTLLATILILCSSWLSTLAIQWDLVYLQGLCNCTGYICSRGYHGMSTPLPPPLVADACLCRLHHAIQVKEMHGKSNRATSCDDEKLEHAAAAAQVEEPGASETADEIYTNSQGIREKSGRITKRKV